jgi:hypothetical protein
MHRSCGYEGTRLYWVATSGLALDCACNGFSTIEELITQVQRYSWSIHRHISVNHKTTEMICCCLVERRGRTVARASNSKNTSFLMAVVSTTEKISIAPALRITRSIKEKLLFFCLLLVLPSHDCVFAVWKFRGAKRRVRN